MANIIHSVIFTLKHAPGSAAAEQFLADGRRILTGIPVVIGFKAFRQVSTKNPHQYGFSMEFATRADYETYNNHPDHVGFVASRWIPEVTDFLEIDYDEIP